MISRFSLGFIVILALISYASYVVAECEPLNRSLQGASDRLNRGITENLDVTLDTEVAVRNHDNLFRLPIGYLHPRPWYFHIKCHNYGGCNPSIRGVPIHFSGFEFRMPGGAYPVNTSTILELKRCEDDLSAEGFVVRVNHLSAFKPDSKKHYMVRSIVLSLQILKGQVSHVKYKKILPERPDGLIEYSNGAPLHPWGGRYFLYEGDDFLLEMGCAPYSPSRACHANVWKESSDLFFRIWFPAEHLNQWKSAIEMANTKLLEWIQE